jgi:hypothetical protein
MRVLVVVNLMAFALGVLLLFSLVTPHDRPRAGNWKGGSNPRSDSPSRAPFAKH